MLVASARIPRVHVGLRRECSAEARFNRLSAMLRTSDVFLLTAAFLSFLFSVYLWFGGQRDTGIFVGIWVPSILAFGCYFRLATDRSRRV